MIKKDITRRIIEILVIIITTLNIVSFYIRYCTNDIQTQNNINHIIDSVKQEKDKLVIEVNNLDSIKNAQIIEVQTIDNDSTLKLFYQLIK